MRRNKETTDKNKQRAADLNKENEQLQASIQKYNGELEDYLSADAAEKRRLKEDSTSVDEAKRAAAETRKLAEKALAEVKSILLQLNDANAADANSFNTLRERLDGLENQFRVTQAKERTNKLDLDRQLKKKAVEQQRREIEELEAEVKNIADIAASLPEGCFRGYVELEPPSG